MPFVYDASPTSGAFRQGEILGDVYDHRPNSPAIEMEPDQVEYVSFHHPWVIILTNDCDPDLDYRERNGLPGENYKPVNRRLLNYVFLCDLYDAATFKTEEIKASDIWKRASQNQDERYHTLNEAQIGERPGNKLPQLCMDFSKPVFVPPDGLYQGLLQAKISRIALVPSPYLEDLTHRFYGFLSRVAVP